MVVELEAVQDTGAVVEAEDVVGEQVAVAVDDAALFDAGIEQRLTASEIAADESLGLVQVVTDAAVEAVVATQVPHLVETRRPAPGQRVPGALLLDLPASGCVGVPRGEQSGDGAQDVVDVGSVADEPGQAAVRGQASHHDHRLRRVRVRAAQLSHAQVDVRREAPVEATSRSQAARRAATEV